MPSRRRGWRPHASRPSCPECRTAAQRCERR
jgi:hypothetical protein